MKAAILIQLTENRTLKIFFSLHNFVNFKMILTTLKGFLSIREICLKMILKPFLK